ncbi:hypothetical protein C6401_15805 [Arthrobacter woluwensis]|uniref:glycosyltransferase family A protein n=1 Tax=Arthrobacter woluwensis TaxID=156980 RepID=UPI000D133AA1|nr:glycosyltransferase family A protein [Arthrobacter woluwensis]PSS42741.1 hypothetical protein C6401_15805 [Arthrobacter woluwensis]
MNQSIDVVIPVHDIRRPAARAVRSVLDQRSGLLALGVDLRVMLVWHNLGDEDVARAAEALPGGDGLRQEVLRDGLHSAAGPRNWALDHSDATFLCFLDSDDHLEPGSLAAWWTCAEDERAAAVIAPLRTPSGAILRSPRIRPSAPRTLDALKDGLVYRSVPYGLLRRSALEFVGYRYEEGLRTGEDLSTTLKLWFRSGTICYPYGAPAYHQTDDSGEGRVTSTVLPIGEEFRWLEALLEDPWLKDATRAERRAIALKVLRVHGVGALLRRAAGTESDAGNAGRLWNAEEQRHWTELLKRLESFAQGLPPALSRRDAALVREACDAGDLASLRAAADRHARAGRAGELLPLRLSAVLSRDAVLTHYVLEKLRTRQGIFRAPEPRA